MDNVLMIITLFNKNRFGNYNYLNEIIGIIYPAMFSLAEFNSINVSLTLCTDVFAILTFCMFLIWSCIYCICPFIVDQSLWAWPILKYCFVIDFMLFLGFSCYFNVQLFAYILLPSNDCDKVYHLYSRFYLRTRLILVPKSLSRRRKMYRLCQ